MQNKTYILGVGITVGSEKKILEYLIKVLKKGRRDKAKDLPVRLAAKRSGKQIVIFTPNPEQISAANKDASLKELLNQAHIALPDGVGVVVGARLLGKPIYARITGVDFMKNLVKSVSEQPIKTGFLGGQPRVAKECAECLQQIWPKLRVEYASDIYDKDKMIHSDIDILFVAFGFPKQERWILEHKDELSATVIMAVGGSFDFIAGRVPRAPYIIQKFGLEWIFRLINQPWRIFRQAQILHFSALIFAEALSSRLKRFKI